MKQIINFKKFLEAEGLSQNSVIAYTNAIKQFLEVYSTKFTSKDLFAYKGFLLDKYKPKTVNLRIQAINRYLAFIGKPELKLKYVRLQQKNFLENVISDADYQFLKTQLLADGDEDLAMSVWFLGATGARVSELLQIKVEHVNRGYIDLMTKGGKIRRLYIPEHLAKESKIWLCRHNIVSGYIFLNNHGKRITARGLAKKLQDSAIRYHLDPKVVHPHSFRHRFAKNFLDKYQDIALLADLLGHESIETTRIYLRRTSSEQRSIVDKMLIGDYFYSVNSLQIPRLSNLFEKMDEEVLNECFSKKLSTMFLCVFCV